MKQIHWLDPMQPQADFPPVGEALANPEGLLAAGGDLSVPRLLRAYRAGIFPWYEPGQPILWWSPDPRAVLFTDRLRITRSLRKTLRNKPYTVSFDRAFREVMLACAEPRYEEGGTWITPEMIEAYCRLHDQGHAHSVEVWNTQGGLIGGLYGVAVGKMFFGESMFTRERDGSKIALAHLVRHLAHWGYPLVDCQQVSAHIMSLGAQTLPRAEFIALLDEYCPQTGKTPPWSVLPELSFRHTDDIDRQAP